MSTLQNYLNDASEKRGSGIYNNTDLRWVRVIKDHREILIKTGSYIELVEFEKNISFKYDLKNFIEKNIVRGASNIKNNNAMWIIMILNNIRDDSDFVDRDFIYVPNEEEIRSLYDEYTDNVI